jgi:hypothetical protein
MTLMFTTKEFTVSTSPVTSLECSDVKVTGQEMGLAVFGSRLRCFFFTSVHCRAHKVCARHRLLSSPCRVERFDGVRFGGLRRTLDRVNATRCSKCPADGHVVPFCHLKPCTFETHFKISLCVNYSQSFVNFVLIGDYKL